MCNCCWFAVRIVAVVLCVLLSSYVYLLYYVYIVVILCVFVVLCVYCCHLMCICCTMCVLLFFTLDAGLLARSQYSEGPATGHRDTGFSWFLCA